MVQIGSVQRGDIDIGINLVALPELTNQAGQAVVKLLRPMTVAQAVIVVPSVKKTTLMSQAFQFMLPFDMVCNVLVREKSQNGRFSDCGL